MYKLLVNKKKKLTLVKIQQLHHNGVCCKSFCVVVVRCFWLISPTNFSSIFVAVFFVSDSINAIKVSQTILIEADN